MTRLLCIHPGADWSTADLYNGLVPALQDQGVECVPYALNTRINHAASWLHSSWQHGGGKVEDRPTDADVVYKASIDSLERALRLNVEWVLVFSAMYFHPDAMILLRKAGVKIALILTESPYEDQAEMNVLQWANVAFTNERSCVTPYRDVNPNVHYLPHAYDPRRHRPKYEAADPTLPCHDVVFVGTPFPERVQTLEAIDWTGIDLGLYGFWDEALGPDSALKRYVRGGVTDNATTAKLYRQAKIGLNLYRTSRHFDGSGGPVTSAESLNPRALELAACECFQISDYRPEVFETFGMSVPVFDTPEELGALVWRYVQSPNIRSMLATTARRCILSHTFSERAERVLSVLSGEAIQPNGTSREGGLNWQDIRAKPA